jgi:hypothetical protein
VPEPTLLVSNAVHPTVNMLVQPADLTGGSHLGLTCNIDGAPALGHNVPFATNASNDGATVAESEESDLEASFAWHDEETRLRYARLAARARAQELAYAQKMERERARDRQRDQGRSRSRSRSNTRTPVFTGFFHHRRERHASHGSATMSRPGTPNNEKSYVTSFLHSSQNSSNETIHSVTRSPLLKFIPIPRSGSSKSIHSSVSSQPASSRPSSPFSSPRTPLSPLPFFLTPKKRRASAVPGPGDDSVPQGLLEGGKGIGVPLARVARRPSPVRAMTPPTTPPPNEEPLQSAKLRSRICQRPPLSFRSRRPSEPAAHGDGAEEDAPHAPHLLFDGGMPLTRVERRRLPPRSQTIGT